MVSSYSTDILRVPGPGLGGGKGEYRDGIQCPSVVLSLIEVADK
jgi:hypothetical protein